MCQFVVNQQSQIHDLRRPFIIDLESTNGTSVNDSPIPTSRYFELQVNDGEPNFYLLNISLIRRPIQSSNSATLFASTCYYTMKRHRTQFLILWSHVNTTSTCMYVRTANAIDVYRPRVLHKKT